MHSDFAGSDFQGKFTLAQAESSSLTNPGIPNFKENHPSVAACYYTVPIVQCSGKSQEALSDYVVTWKKSTATSASALPSWIVETTAANGDGRKFAVNPVAAPDVATIIEMIGTHEIYVLVQGSNVYDKVTGDPVGTDGYVLQTITITCNENGAGYTVSNAKTFTSDITGNVFYTGSEFFKVTFSDPGIVYTSCGTAAANIRKYRISYPDDYNGVAQPTTSNGFHAYHPLVTDGLRSNVVVDA